MRGRRDGEDYDDEDDEDLVDEGPDPNPMSRALGTAIEAVMARSFRRDFAEVVREYKLVEEEFVRRTADDAGFVLETRRRIAERILEKAAWNQPFEVFQKCWEDMLALGFTILEIRCTMSWFYANGCLRTGKIEAGLAVLEPLIAEVERLLAEPTVTRPAARYYRYEIDNLGKLRDKLEASQEQGGATP